MVSRRESTTIQSAKESHSCDTIENSVITSETSNIFYQLRSSELLKHLLATNDRSSSYCTRTRQNESCSKEPTVVSQNAANVSSAVIQCDDGEYTIPNHTDIQYAANTCRNIIQTTQNGSMERDFIETAEFSEEVQSSASEFFVKNCCNSTTISVEDELPPYYDAVSKQIVDDIMLAEARMLCIESSSSSSFPSNSCVIGSLSNSTNEVARHSSSASSKNVFLRYSVESEADSADSKNSVNCDNDGDVEKSMVLVPAGNIVCNFLLILLLYE